MNDNRRDSSLPIALEERMKPFAQITAAVAGIGETASWIDKIVIPKVGVFEEQSKLYSDPFASLPMALEEHMKPFAQITAAVAGIGETASWIDKMVIPKVGVFEEQSKLYSDPFASLPMALEERMKPFAQITAAVAGIGKMNTGVEALTAITAGMPKFYAGIGKMNAGVQAMSALRAVRPSVFEELSKSVANISVITAGNKSHKKYYDDIYSNVVYGEFQESHELTTYDLFERSDIEDLEFDLERVLQHTPELRARWPVIKQALESHRDRRYLASVKCLYPQFEGILVDYLVSEDLLTVESYKVYKKQNDSFNSKRTEVKGLKSVAYLIENSDLPKTHFLAAYIKEYLGDERNAILHGRKLDYGSADRSMWLIRCIYAIACKIHTNEVWRQLENLTQNRNLH